MYHVEIRQFPHNAWRFNLADGDLPPILFPWVREHAVDFGERKWSPHTARLTILEGPQLAIEQLTMGRGWQAAQRDSHDVTERLLQWAKDADANAAQERAGAERGAGGGQAPPDGAQPAGTERRAAGVEPDGGGVNDPLGFGVQIAALLGAEPARLLEAWRAAADAAPDLSPSESLARAEADLRA